MKVAGTAAVPAGATAVALTVHSNGALADGHATVTREVDGGLETLKITLPAIVTVGLSLGVRRMAAANAIVRPFGRFIKKLKTVDLVPPILHFRESVYDLLKRRWATITAAQVGVALTQFLVLYIALRGVEGWDQPGTSIIAAFAAFSAAICAANGVDLREPL